MEMETISLSQALEIFNRRDRLQQPVPFDVSFRTFSKTTKKGGRLVVLEGVTYLPSANPENAKPNIIGPDRIKRDANHYENRTRNVQLPDGGVRKVNIDFIILVNNLKVIY